MNKAVLYGQEMRVNWAFQKEVKTDAASYVHVFVGDLASDITDAMLFQVGKPPRAAALCSSQTLPSADVDRS